MGKEQSRSPEREQFKLKESSTRREKKALREWNQRLMLEPMQGQTASLDSGEGSASPSPARKPPTIPQRMLQKE